MSQLMTATTRRTLETGRYTAPQTNVAGQATAACGSIAGWLTGRLLAPTSLRCSAAIQLVPILSVHASSYAVPLTWTVQAVVFHYQYIIYLNMIAEEP